MEAILDSVSVLSRGATRSLLSPTADAMSMRPQRSHLLITINVIGELYRRADLTTPVDVISPTFLSVFNPFESFEIGIVTQL